MLFTWMCWLVNLLMTVDCIDDEGLTQNAVASRLPSVQICVSAVCQSYNLQISLISSTGLGIFLNSFSIFMYCITRSNNFVYFEIPMLKNPAILSFFVVGIPGI